MELDKIRDEYEEILKIIKDLEDILANESRRFQIIKEELLEIKGIKENTLDKIKENITL